MPLTDTALRAVKATEKAQKLFDGNGLFLFVSPSGTKSWRLKYRFQGKEKLLTLGTYPQTSLKEARERVAYCRELRLYTAQRYNRMQSHENTYS